MPFSEATQDTPLPNVQLPVATEALGGRDRARTGDPLLAKQVLFQLSYTPTR